MTEENKKSSVVKDFNPISSKKEKIESFPVLSKIELDVIKELQKLIGKTLPKVNRVMWGKIPKHQLGYVVNNGHITELGLCPRVRGSLLNPDFQLSSLPDSLQSLKKLRILDLSSNGLMGFAETGTDPGLNLLPEWFGNLKLLEELNLSWNKLSTLPETFGNIESLRILHLYKNRLHSLPESFGKLRNLRELYLSQNNLENLPNSFESLRSLQELDLKGNQLKELPESFGNLPILQKLSLAENNLKNIPESFGNLMTLQQLSLAENDLKKLPDSISQLNALHELNIYGNNLIVLPESFGNIITLVELDLRYNKFVDLPKSFAMLNHLKSVHFEKNPWNEEFDKITTMNIQDMIEALRRKAGLCVFIINSTADQIIADKITADLKRGEIFQVECCNMMSNSENFHDFILKSDVVIFLSSVKSRECRDLLEFAKTQNLRIISIKGKDISYENLAIVGLDKVDCVEFHKGDIRGLCNKLYNKILNTQSKHDPTDISERIFEVEMTAFNLKSRIRDIVDSDEFMNFLTQSLPSGSLQFKGSGRKSKELAKNVIDLFKSFLNFDVEN